MLENCSEKRGGSLMVNLVSKWAKRKRRLLGGWEGENILLFDKA